MIDIETMSKLSVIDELLTPIEDQNLDLLKEALYNRRGVYQSAIARAGLGLIAKLLRKNHDYGGSVFEPPILAPSMKPEEALRVRMSDKIKRVQTLLQVKSEVTDESIVDTLHDLGGYIILDMALKGLELEE